MPDEHESKYQLPNPTVICLSEVAHRASCCMSIPLKGGEVAIQEPDHWAGPFETGEPI